MGRFGDMFPIEAMRSLNETILSRGDVQSLLSNHVSGNRIEKTFLSGAKLNIDFDDFVSNYSRHNPLGTIEWIALGYGEESKFYQVVDDPRMMFSSSRSKPVPFRGEFNEAFITLKTREDRKTITGYVNFGKAQSISTDDPSVEITWN